MSFQTVGEQSVLATTPRSALRSLCFATLLALLLTLSLRLHLPTRGLCNDVATGSRAGLHAENPLTTKHVDGDAPLFSPLGSLPLPARVVALIRERDLRRFAFAQENEDGLPIDIVLVIWNV
jgi:hypothetical protein